MRDDFDPVAELAFLQGVLAGRTDSMRDLAARLTCIRRFLSARNSVMGFPLNDDEVDDTVQGATVIVLRRLPHFRPVAPLESWVHGICMLEFSEAVRTKARRAQRARPLDAEVPAPERPLADALSDAQQVETALLRLSGIEAEVVTLKHLDGYTFEELSQRLAISVNTAKSHYYRGLAKLRTSMTSPEGSA